MKYAMVNDAKSEAKKGLQGSCPNCGNPVISKCGEKKIHHWSHKGKLECDPWRENETEWHRAWKGHFPVECQEVVHRDEITGEKHIADVKTSVGIVLEFQHSPIKTEERRSRNDFYKNIVWVVDGKRLQRDEAKFTEAYDSGASIGHVKKVHTSESSLLEDWSEMNVCVFFDFGQPVLWLLVPIITDATSAYIFPLSKLDFLEIFRDNHFQKWQTFWSFLKEFIMFIRNPPRQQFVPQRLQLQLPRRPIYTNRRRKRFRRF